jgi:hypothetical protein
LSLLADKRSSSSSEGHEEEGGEEELLWLLACLPLDLHACFPFALFHGLEQAVRAYPSRRFRLRALEAGLLAVLVVGVMSVSALTKMHSAGYI